MSKHWILHLVVVATVLYTSAVCADEPGVLRANELREQAVAAQQEYFEALGRDDANAERLAEKAAEAWEAFLELEPDDSKAHREANFMLVRSMGIGGGRESHIERSPEELQGIWRRIAFHRRRMFELAGERDCAEIAAINVAGAYLRAGDFEEAIRYFKLGGNLLIPFQHYRERNDFIKAEEVFAHMEGFQARYKAASSALGRTNERAEFAIHLSELMLKNEPNPHHRAALYRIMAQANAKLWRAEAVLENAKKATKLNPKSPWGWYWLAEGYSMMDFLGPMFRAEEAMARKRELTFFTGNSEEDRRARAAIYSKLGLLYRTKFHQPETAISYWRKELEERSYLPEYPRVGAGNYENIIITIVHDLHDRARAQKVLDEAKSIGAGFLTQSASRKELRRMGFKIDD